jgi:hypothetical protein
MGEQAIYKTITGGVVMKKYEKRIKANLLSHSSKFLNFSVGQCLTDME